MGLSFLYGVFHAAGPGHGKVVISSYVLANETQLKRGVTLSALSALLQSLVAIGFVLIAAGVLGMTSIAMGDAANWIGIISYAMVALLGLWLIARKIFDWAHSHGHAHAQPDMASKARAHLHDGEHHHHDHDHGGHDHHEHDHAHHDDHRHDEHHDHVHIVPPEATTGVGVSSLAWCWQSVCGHVWVRWSCWCLRCRRAFCWRGSRQFC